MKVKSNGFYVIQMKDVYGKDVKTIAEVTLLNDQQQRLYVKPVNHPAEITNQDGVISKFGDKQSVKFLKRINVG